MRGLHQRNDPLICVTTTCRRPPDFGCQRAKVVASSLLGSPHLSARRYRSCVASKLRGGASSDRAVCGAATRRPRLVSMKRFYFCELCGAQFETCMSSDVSHGELRDFGLCVDQLLRQCHPDYAPDSAQRLELA